MSELLLREVPEGRGNIFEVLDEGGPIIGRIVLLTALARTHGTPWMWSIDSTFHEGCERTYGFEVTREAAMQAFTRRWFRTGGEAGQKKAGDG